MSKQKLNPIRRRAGIFTLLRRPRAMFRFLSDPNAPKMAQFVAFATLAYLVFPLDLIPDVIPIIGWLDDLGLVTLAIAFTASQAAKYENKKLSVLPPLESAPRAAPQGEPA